jgi:hypothetical protein
VNRVTSLDFAGRQVTMESDVCGHIANGQLHRMTGGTFFPSAFSCRQLERRPGKQHCGLPVRADEQIRVHYVVRVLA